MYRDLFTSKIGINGHANCRIITDDNNHPIDYLIIQVNETFALLSGKTKTQLEGKTAHQIFGNEENFSIRFIEDYGKTALEGIEMNTEFYFEPAKKWLLFYAFSHTHGEFTIIISDITERKNSEERYKDLAEKLEFERENLKHSEEFFRTLADNISQFAWMADKDGSIFWYNKRWYDYTGTTFEQMKGWGWKSVHHPDYVEKVEKKFTDSIRKGEEWEDIFPLRSKDGEYRWFLSRALPVYNDRGEITHWFGTNTDITDQKKLEEDLKLALDSIEDAYKINGERLKEKEVLLRELYHRTKNNMQVISSLLGLKASAFPDRETEVVFEDMQKRIRAIALVHEKLYQSKNLSRVNLKEYILDLVRLLFDSHTINKDIQFRHDLEEITVLIDTAVPIGLVITELIMNSLKYAFPGNKTGYIEIKLKRLEDESIQLKISDNGVGFHENDMNKNNKLGLHLFKNIAENQLDGELELNLDKGVSWTITFKDTLYTERV